MVKATKSENKNGFPMPEKAWIKANSADPDQTPHNMASDQGLYCLLTGLARRLVREGLYYVCL